MCIRQLASHHSPAQLGRAVMLQTFAAAPRVEIMRTPFNSTATISPSKVGWGGGQYCLKHFKYQQILDQISMLALSFSTKEEVDKSFQTENNVAIKA